MKQLRVIVQLRNNLLQQRREELGMNQAQLCRAAGIAHRGAYGALESMKRSPFSPRGDWRPIVLTIARFHGLSPEELFPPEILALRGGKRDMTCDVTEFAELAACGPEMLLSLREQIGSVKPLLSAALTSTEADVITRRFGLDGDPPSTLKDCRPAPHYSLERTRQIEMRALKQMRDQSRDPFEKNEIWRAFEAARADQIR